MERNILITQWPYDGVHNSTIYTPEVHNYKVSTNERNEHII